MTKRVRAVSTPECEGSFTLRTRMAVLHVRVVISAPCGSA